MVAGRKGPADVIILISADKEILNFGDLLFILLKYFESEDSYYPIDQGFQGKSMLLKAIVEVYSGVPLERVLRFYKLESKAVIIDQTSHGKSMEKKQSVSALHELM